MSRTDDEYEEEQLKKDEEEFNSRFAPPKPCDWDGDPYAKDVEEEES